MDSPQIECVDRAFSIEYWLVESMITAWSIRFKTDLKTHNFYVFHLETRYQEANK